MSTVFRGERDFYAILKKAQRENWAALPIGDRIVRVGRELHGRPYEGFTLEIHDRIESPSVNLKGLDCWTFFEICLGFARMLGWKRPDYSPKNLLREIEFTRYRAGVCHGNYLDRIPITWQNGFLKTKPAGSPRTSPGNSAVPAVHPGAKSRR